MNEPTQPYPSTVKSSIINQSRPSHHTKHSSSSKSTTESATSENRVHFVFLGTSCAYDTRYQVPGILRETSSEPNNNNSITHIILVRRDTAGMILRTAAEQYYMYNSKYLLLAGVWCRLSVVCYTLRYTHDSPQTRHQAHPGSVHTNERLMPFS